MKQTKQDKFIRELIIGFPHKVKKYLKQWFKDGNDINQPFYTGSYILHYAVDGRKHHLVSLRLLPILFQCPNLDLNVRDAKGETPLMIAARSEDRMAMMMLLDQGADYTLRNKSNQLFYELMRDSYWKRQMIQHTRIRERKKQTAEITQPPQQASLPAGQNKPVKEEAIPYYKPQKNIWKFFSALVSRKAEKPTISHSENKPLV